MNRQAVCFTMPGEVAVCEEPVPQPAEGQVLVQTLASAISAGTEMLFYRGQVPPDMAVDETISALQGRLAYPLKYGYSAVGRVIACGVGVPTEWVGRLVCAFHPHESHFTATPDELIPIPAGTSPEQAVFLPNIETALTLVLDGQPLIGEQVVVFGQGIVGLLTTALLARFPLASLVTLDSYQLRREASLAAGAHTSLNPQEGGALDSLHTLLRSSRPYRGADLTYELSGMPQALDQAIAITGYHGRVVVGSWYGQKPVTLNLGGSFHRSRIRLISSQVSTIAPDLRGRWSPQRRFDTAWQMIPLVRPERFITHRFPVTEAARAYQLLDQAPDTAIQVIFRYDVDR